MFIETTTIATAVYLELIIISFAYLEIQIEGENFWAGKLPCWRKKVKWLGKDITGYHVGLIVFTLLLLYHPYATLGVPFSIAEGLYLFSLAALISLFEDFTWSLINPSEKFGVVNFKKNYIPLKNIFIGGLPIDYYFAVVLSSLFAFGAGRQNEWLGVFSVLLGITVIITLLRYRYDIRKN